MALSKTLLANMALAQLGSKRINDIDADTSVEAIQCRTHYDQTWDELLCSFEWYFASTRVILVEDTKTPDFEWEHQYLLPNDFLRLKKFYNVDEDGFDIEGNLLLANSTFDDELPQIKYIKKISDPNEVHPLFVMLFVLCLAKKLINPLAGTDAPLLTQTILLQIKDATARARAVCRAETETRGRSDWNLARYGSGIV